MQRTQSRPTRILLVGLGAVLLLAIFLMWTTHARRTADTASVSAVPTAAGDARAVLEDAALPASAASRRDKRESVGSAPVDANSPTSTTALTETIEVLVVDIASNKPVANAELHYWASTEGAYRNLHLWEWSTSGEFESHMQSGGETSTTDADGKARVKRPQDGAIVMARAGALWAQGFLPHDTASTWRLDVDRDLSVLVVDAHGVPVGGANVVLRRRSGEWSEDFDMVVTRESDGLAILQGVGRMLRQHGDNKMSVALGGVFEKPIEVGLDPMHLPEGPVRLVIPAFGACEVLVLGPDGEAYLDELVVRLRQLTSEERANGVSPRSDPSGIMVISKRGRALFQHVTPGLELVATVSRSRANHSAVGPGPTAAGQTARITVRLGETLAIVRGRAVDASGNPVKNSRFNAWVEGGKEAPTGGDHNIGVESDDQGRFHVDLLPRTPTDGACALVLVAGEKSASRPLPAILTPGVHDLGDFALLPTPIIASGRVVKGNNAPVRQAWVSVSVENVKQGGWENLWNVHAESDAEGRFVLRGRVEADTISLSARKQRDWTADPVVVARGATDVVLVMRANGAIAGRVLLDPSLPKSAVRVYPERFEGDLSSPGELGDDGNFALGGLAPGVYTVTLRRNGALTSLHAVEGVRVASGETTRDPRLDPLDLRTSLAAITLTIVDSDRQPVLHGSVRATLLAAKGKTQLDAAKFENGKAVLTHDGSGFDVVITSTGFRDARLEHVREDRTVTLLGAPRLTLVLAGRQRPPEKPFGLGVVLTPAESEGTKHDDVYFDAQGRLSMFAPSAGRMRVEIRLDHKPDNDEWADTFVVSETESFIDVRDVAGEQVFEVACDATALARAMERLRKKDR